MMNDNRRRLAVALSSALVELPVVMSAVTQRMESEDDRRHLAVDVAAEA